MNGNAKEIPLWRAMPELIEAKISKLEQEKHELLKQVAANPKSVNTPDLLHAAKSALEILSRPAIFPQDIEAMRKMLSEVIKKSETV